MHWARPDRALRSILRANSRMVSRAMQIAMRIGVELREAPGAAEVMLMTLKLNLVRRLSRVDRHPAHRINDCGRRLRSLRGAMFVIGFVVHLRSSLSFEKTF